MITSFISHWSIAHSLEQFFQTFSTQSKPPVPPDPQLTTYPDFVFIKKDQFNSTLVEFHTAFSPHRHVLGVTPFLARPEFLDSSSVLSWVLLQHGKGCFHLLLSSFHRPPLLPGSAQSLHLFLPLFTNMLRTFPPKKKSLSSILLPSATLAFSHFLLLLPKFSELVFIRLFSHLLLFIQSGFEP